MAAFNVSSSSLREARFGARRSTARWRAASAGLGVGNDAEGGPEVAGDLDRVDVDADQLQVAVDAPAQLRLMQAGPDRQHDIGLAP